jgi:hypothetical protein
MLDPAYHYSGVGSLQEGNPRHSEGREANLSRPVAALSRRKGKDVIAMDGVTRARIEAAGFRETTVEELLGLTAEEKELVETRLALSRLIRQLRHERGLTQKAVAARLGSNQANISRAEGNDPDISLEWLFRAAFALGASREQIGRAIGGP